MIQRCIKSNIGSRNRNPYTNGTPFSPELCIIKSVLTEAF